MKKRLAFTAALFSAALITAALPAGMTAEQNKPTLQNTGAECTDSSTLAKKPVIYLYGYKGEDVTVNLSIDGNITMTYPKADNGTWEFKTDNAGNMVVDSITYRYLFWEGDLDFTPTFAKGYCVRGDATEHFLEDKLSALGFNAQEKEDFITYWVPQMKDNNYNVISFQTTAYTRAARLNVTPKPDRSIRVFMAWYPAETFVNLPEQTFRIPKRTGRVLVEWGGAQVNPLLASTATSLTTGTALTGNTQTTAPQTTSDPYAQYGALAQCARDWDSSGISSTMGKWATLTEQTKGEAYNHWTHYGKVGW